MTAYDNSSAVATSTWVASVSGAQAYALVMEGYAAANATSGNGIFASSVSQPLIFYQHSIQTHLNRQLSNG